MDQQKQQQQQMQQQQMETAMQEQMARIELSKSRAMADQGLGIERISRVQENEALAIERRAEAEKDRDQATLNMVRALKELETIDISHIEETDYAKSSSKEKRKTDRRC